MLGINRLQGCVVAVAAAGVLSLAGCLTSPDTTAAQEVVALWDGPPPNAKTLAAEESQVVMDHGWRSILEIHNVSIPTMTVVRPPEGQANGSAMLVLPGGAFSILAWDVEGTEVASFLAERGITAFILKYRVNEPTPEQVQAYVESMSDPDNAADPAFFVKALRPKHELAVEDALQAVRLVRAGASRYGVDPDRLGMIGYSAGAATIFTLLQRADDATRPDIAAPIYGFAYDTTAPAKAPPLFMAVARDDAFMAAASADVQEAWQTSGKSSELHIFESGAHGFGMGRPGTESMKIGSLLEDWLREHGFVE